jgi:vitamin K-dependent gamma-carboxylase
MRTGQRTESRKKPSIIKTNFPQSGLWARCQSRLAAPVDGASLAFFRIAFGLILAYHVAKDLGWFGGANFFHFMYRDVGFHFAYRGFEWVKPLSGSGLTLLATILVIASLLLALGLCYRLAAVVAFLSYTYFFLLDQSDYNNHYYLICLVTFLLIWVPADRCFSLQAFVNRKLRKPEAPATDSPAIPYWGLFLIQFQLVVMYFYGGIAKINIDWLNGSAMLSKGVGLRESLFVPLGLGEWISPHLASLFITWGGLVFDLAIPALLIIRRTRLFAILLTGVFHLHNHLTFPIGIFPAMAFSASLIFFEPDWPRRVYRWLRKPSISRPDLNWLIPGAVAFPVVGAALGWRDYRSGWFDDAASVKVPTLVLAGTGRAGQSSLESPPKQGPPKFSPELSFGVQLFVIVWTITQTLIPFRHNFIPGDANWTEQGQKFSWRMMLRTTNAGHVTYYVEDETLISRDGAGPERIDWEAMDASVPRAVYTSIRSKDLDWRHYVAPTITREPVLGERLVIASRKLTSESVAGSPQTQNDRCEEFCQKLSKVAGRSIAVSPALTLGQAASEIRGRLPLTPSAELTASRLQIAREALDLIDSVEWQLATQPESVGSHQILMLIDCVTTLLKPELRELTESSIAKLAPFQIQGARYEGWEFLVATVAPIAAAGDESTNPATDTWKRLSGTNEYAVLIDLDAMPRSGWQSMPRWFVCLESERPRIVWNYHPDLNFRQLKDFATTPDLMHQYAQHVAMSWQAETGRYPQVYVDNLAMMNFRGWSPKVDPEADLASVSYHLMSHNPWILPPGERASERLAKIAEIIAEGSEQFR